MSGKIIRTIVSVFFVLAVSVNAVGLAVAATAQTSNSTTLAGEVGTTRG